MTPIPANIDAQCIINDLNAWGWRDYKIEQICGLNRGYAYKLRHGQITSVSYSFAARLYNFWLEESEKRANHTP